MFDPMLALSQLTQNKNPVAVLKMFLGASDFLKSDKESWIRFKFKGCSKMNMLTIRLTPADLYEMEFGKVTNRVDRKLLQSTGIRVSTPEYNVVEKLDGVYCEDLKRIFEETTGLYLSF